VTDQGGGATHGQIQLEGGNLGLIRGRASIAGGAFKDKLRYSFGLAYLNVMSGVDGQNAYRSAGIQGSVRSESTRGTTQRKRSFLAPNPTAAHPGADRRPDCPE
jgi:vitamin B12 transporter